MEPPPSPQAIPVLDYAMPSPRGRIWGIIKVVGIYLAAAIFGAAAAGLFGWLILPKQYLSVARVYLFKEGVVTLGLPPRSNFLNTQAAAMESPALRAAASQGLSSRFSVTPQQWAEATITAEVERRTDLIRLSVISSDPNAAKFIADAVFQQFERSSPALRVGVVEPPRVSVRVFNRPLLGTFAVFGALVSLLLIYRHRQKIRFSQ